MAPPVGRDACSAIDDGDCKTVPKMGKSCQSRFSTSPARLSPGLRPRGGGRGEGRETVMGGCRENPMATATYRCRRQVVTLLPFRSCCRGQAPPQMYRPRSMIRFRRCPAPGERVRFVSLTSTRPFPNSAPRGRVSRRCLASRFANAGRPIRHAGANRRAWHPHGKRDDEPGRDQVPKPATIEPPAPHRAHLPTALPEVAPFNNVGTQRAE